MERDLHIVASLCFEPTQCSGLWFTHNSPWAWSFHTFSSTVSEGTLSGIRVTVEGVWKWWPIPDREALTAGHRSPALCLLLLKLVFTRCLSSLLEAKDCLHLVHHQCGVWHIAHAEWMYKWIGGWAHVSHWGMDSPVSGVLVEGEASDWPHALQVILNTTSRETSSCPGPIMSL